MNNDIDGQSKELKDHMMVVACKAWDTAVAEVRMSMFNSRVMLRAVIKAMLANKNLMKRIAEVAHQTPTYRYYIIDQDCADVVRTNSEEEALKFAQFENFVVIDVIDGCVRCDIVNYTDRNPVKEAK